MGLWMRVDCPAIEEMAGYRRAFGPQRNEIDGHPTAPTARPAQRVIKKGLSQH